MYAVIKAGGRQHRVKPGDVIEVELSGAEAGQEIEFRPLLVVDDDGKAHFGKEVGKAVVVATPVGEQKGEKVKVFKYRPKSGYSRRQGHRQLLTLVEISDVRMGGRQASKKTEEPAAETEAKPAAKPSGKAKPAATSSKSKAAAKPAAKAPAKTSSKGTSSAKGAESGAEPVATADDASSADAAPSE